MALGAAPAKLVVSIGIFLLATRKRSEKVVFGGVMLAGCAWDEAISWPQFPCTPLEAGCPRTTMTSPSRSVPIIYLQHTDSELAGRVVLSSCGLASRRGISLTVVFPVGQHRSDAANGLICFASPAPHHRARRFWERLLSGQLEGPGPSSSGFLHSASSTFPQIAVWANGPEPLCGFARCSRKHPEALGKAPTRQPPPTRH
jgi:hypothetical protein